MRLEHLVVVSLLCAAQAAAQVPLSGDVYDGHGGPLLSGVVYQSTGFVVPTGTTLTVEPGAIVKFDGGSIVLNGRLEATGTELQRITLTSLLNDSLGGDTNGDGTATQPTPGDWGGIIAQADSSLTLIRTDMSYFGQLGAAGIACTAPTAWPFVESCTLDHGLADGIDLGGHEHDGMQIDDTKFTDNGGIAIDGLDIRNVGNNFDNSASGNGGNYVNVTQGNLYDWSGIWTNNYFGGALVVSCDLVVWQYGWLDCYGPVVMKFRDGGIVSNGWDFTAGHAVFTSFADDAFGGDTNGDGSATQPAPGDWRGIIVNSIGEDPPPANVDGAVIRYAGKDGWAGFTTNEAKLRVFNVRAEHCAGDGFRIGAAAVVENLVAWDCATGFRLVSGQFQLTSVTAAECGAGIVGEGPFQGQVISSIAWGNGTDWQGLSDVVRWSDGVGIVGGDGNIAADPLFVDAAAGNLRLAPSSPCIDAGWPLYVPGHPGGSVEPGDFDPSAFPRLMDGDLDGTRRIDMGAHEFDNLELAVSGDLAPGGTMTITTLAHAAFADVYLVAGVGFIETTLPHFGPWFIDLASPSIVLPWPPASSSVVVDLPPDLPHYFSIWMQLGARVQAVPGTMGNTSNPVSPYMH